jgi:hypothetical protein
VGLSVVLRFSSSNAFVLLDRKGIEEGNSRDSEEEVSRSARHAYKAQINPYTRELGRLLVPYAAHELQHGHQLHR